MVYFKLFSWHPNFVALWMLCSLIASPGFCQNFIEVCALKAIDFITRIHEFIVHDFYLHCFDVYLLSNWIYIFLDCAGCMLILFHVSLWAKEMDRIITIDSWINFLMMLVAFNFVNGWIINFKRKMHQNRGKLVSMDECSLNPFFGEVKLYLVVRRMHCTCILGVGEGWW